jgi:hypothetical protein
LLKSNNKNTKELRNILLSFSKNDSNKMFTELRKIKENLKVINSTINNLNDDNTNNN